MDINNACELAYKNGFEKGVAAGRAAAIAELVKELQGPLSDMLKKINVFAEELEVVK